MIELVEKAKKLGIKINNKTVELEISDDDLNKISDEVEARYKDLEKDLKEINRRL